MTGRALALLLIPTAIFATEPNAATRHWWSHVQALAGDDLEGRDAGSDGYRKAARYVSTQFERAGLKPAGDGGYYQSVPLQQIRFRADLSKVELVRASGTTKLEWLRQISVPARTGMPEHIEAPMVFIAANDPAEGVDVAGKIVVQLSGPRLVPGAAKTFARNGATATLSIDDPGGPEPPHWPVAYSRAMSLRATDLPAAGAAPLALQFNREFAEVLFEGSGHTYKELKAMAAAGKPLPHFEMPASLRAELHFENNDLDSENILATLPGTDPVLKEQYIVVSAHLDGYGIGEPRNGDRIYNGAFDDAAYVATLIDFAEKLHASGTTLKRSILFAVVTAEEKGLLGSRYFAQHPTVPIAKMVANINLDQLRPIFPLKLLTALAVDESTLGDTARAVGGPMGIRIRPDPEPERGSLRRSDHFNFLQAGVPAIGFIFGYEPGSPEEVVYRKWYAERYHSPADDLKQPWLPEAAAKFNTFFDTFVETLANAPDRPRWKPGNSFGK